MSRIETTTRTLYKFEELSNKAKANAAALLCNINVDREWWEFTYEDAARIGVEITEFDINRGDYLEATFIGDIGNIAVKILAEHGSSCETYRLAKEFKAYYEFEERCEEFKRKLKEEYLKILRSEFEYLTSYESIVETIQANDYEFTEDGKLV